jgi:hypothetical protein
VSLTDWYEIISNFELTELFNKAYLKTLTTMLKVISSFRDQGIWPLSTDEFAEVDFEASQQTNYTILQIIQKEAYSAKEILTSDNKTLIDVSYDTSTARPEAEAPATVKAVSLANISLIPNFNI